MHYKLTIIKIHGTGTEKDKKNKNQWVLRESRKLPSIFCTFSARDLDVFHLSHTHM